MRALFGLDPDGAHARAIDAAGLFEEALAFYASEYLLRIFRGPRSPWARMQRAARKLDALIYAEIRAGARPASAGWTSSACCSTPKTRTATRSTTRRSATRS